jgi:hypothetical protein
MKSERAKYTTASIILRTEEAQVLAYNRLMAAPIDPDRPLEMIIREVQKARTGDQNSAMWAGPLKDISEQAWVQGRVFPAKVWNEFFKEAFLPEEAEEGITKEGYQKWATTPSGKRVLVGSSTDLTSRGFGLYMEELTAYGANLGVRFHASPREGRG